MSNALVQGEGWGALALKGGLRAPESCLRLWFFFFFWGGGSWVWGSGFGDRGGGGGVVCAACSFGLGVFGLYYKGAPSPRPLESHAPVAPYHLLCSLSCSSNRIAADL